MAHLYVCCLSLYYRLYTDFARHGEAEANELRGVKKTLGKAHFMKHPDFPNKEEPWPQRVSHEFWIA